MNASANPARNKRRARRKSANFTCTVTDVISNRVIGHLGDLSVSGLMLICSHQPETGAIHQLRLPVQGAHGHAHPLEIGVQSLWHRAAAIPGQTWVGFRIIAISDDDAAALRAWLALPG